LRGIEEQAGKLAAEGGNAAAISSRLKASLASYVYDQIGRRPVIQPLVIEI